MAITIAKEPIKSSDPASPFGPTGFGVATGATPSSVPTGAFGTVIGSTPSTPGTEAPRGSAVPTMGAAPSPFSTIAGTTPIAPTPPPSIGGDTTKSAFSGLKRQLTPPSNFPPPMYTKENIVGSKNSRMNSRLPMQSQNFASAMQGLQNSGRAYY